MNGFHLYWISLTYNELLEWIIMKNNKSHQKTKKSLSPFEKAARQMAIESYKREQIKEEEDFLEHLENRDRLDWI